LVSELADDHGMTELIEMYIDSLPRQVTAIEHALDERDLGTLANLAHQLKGSAGGYGFPSITEAAAELEDCASVSGELGSLRDKLDVLATLCRRVEPARASAAGSPATDADGSSRAQQTVCTQSSVHPPKGSGNEDQQAGA